MRRALIVLPLVTVVLTAVSGSAAFLNLGDAFAQVSRYPVSVGPIGHCAGLPAEVVCIEIPPPSAPTLLGCDGGNLRWDGSLTAARYSVYHAVLSIGPEHLDSVPRKQTNYGLRPSLLVHRYHVTASSLGGESAPSATIAAQCAPALDSYSGPHALGASTLLETDPPPASFNATAASLPLAASDDGPDTTDAEPASEATSEPKAVELPPTRVVELSWAQDGRSMLYAVLRSTTPGGPYVQAGVVERGSSFTDEVATAATYYYVVVGVDEQGAESHPSEEIVSPGIVLPPVVKAPKTLPTMSECLEDSDETAVAFEGEDGEQLCVAPSTTPTPTPTPTATPTPAPSPKPGEGDCSDPGLEETCEPSAGPPPADGRAPSGGAGGASESSSTPPPAASGTPTAEPTPSATPTPDATPVLEPTAAPTAEPAPSPEAEASPAATSEPLPAVEPTPDAALEPAPEARAEATDSPE